MSIYTKTGDTGETGLFGGGRVAKDDLRVAAYGDVDELNSVIGMAMACEPQSLAAELLLGIQHDLFSIGGQLATPKPAKVEKAIAKADLPAERIADLEAAMDDADTRLPPLKAFVLPGGTMKASLFHQARTVCRRAERRVVALSHGEAVPPVILAYLNRLSDLLFTLARIANRDAGVQDRTW